MRKSVSNNEAKPNTGNPTDLAALPCPDPSASLTEPPRQATRRSLGSRCRRRASRAGLPRALSYHRPVSQDLLDERERQYHAAVARDRRVALGRCFSEEESYGCSSGGSCSDGGLMELEREAPAQQKTMETVGASRASVVMPY